MMLEFWKTALTVLAAWLSYLAARWLLGISSPEKDFREMLTWRIFQIDLKWYRGLEFLHQMKAKTLLDYE